MSYVSCVKEGVRERDSNPKRSAPNHFQAADCVDTLEPAAPVLARAVGRLVQFGAD